MKISLVGNFSATILSACILGLLTCPVGYILMGALLYISLMFSLIFLPPLLTGSGFLLWRFISKPKNESTSTLLLVLEGVSWSVILFFLFIISVIRLAQEFERSGVACLFFLLALLLWLPVVVIRKTALKQRLLRLPPSISLCILFVILAFSAFLEIAWYFYEPGFI